VRVLTGQELAAVAGGSPHNTPGAGGKGGNGGAYFSVASPGLGIGASGGVAVAKISLKGSVNYGPGAGGGAGKAG